jgi:hypothetical protein
MQFIILPNVLYGCQTWSFTRREEHRVRVFKNRVLKRIFEPKREEVAGGWRRLHSKELHNLYASLNIIRVTESRRMRWAGHVTLVQEMRKTYLSLSQRISLSLNFFQYKILLKTILRSNIIIIC